ncbi:Nn.00g024360.m01.CDS01 [Neocucurbitaria sp. VM-36]
MSQDFRQFPLTRFTLGQITFGDDEQMNMTDMIDRTGGDQPLYPEKLDYSNPLSMGCTSSPSLSSNNDPVVEDSAGSPIDVAYPNATYSMEYDDLNFYMELSWFNAGNESGFNPQYPSDYDPDVFQSRALNDTNMLSTRPSFQVMPSRNLITNPARMPIKNDVWLTAYQQPTSPLLSTNSYVRDMQLPAFDPTAPSDFSLRLCGPDCTAKCHKPYHEGGHRETHRTRLLFVDNAHLVPHWPPRAGAYNCIPSPIQSFVDAVLEMRPRKCLISDPYMLVQYYRSGETLPGCAQGDAVRGFGEVGKVEGSRGVDKAKEKKVRDRRLHRVAKGKRKGKAAASAEAAVAAAAAEEHARLVWRVWEGTGQ